VDNGQQLGAGVGSPGPGKAEQLVGGRLDTEPLGEGGGQQQPGVGDGVGVVEAGGELVEGMRHWHRKGALLGWRYGWTRNPIIAGQRALLISASARHPIHIGGSRLIPRAASTSPDHVTGTR